MERPKYKLIIIFLMLNLILKESGAFTAMEGGVSNSTFHSQAPAYNSCSYFKQQIYQAFISGKMKNWKTAIDAMEKQNNNEPGFLLELINYQYGYVAWCLGNDKKNEAKTYLLLLEENLERFRRIAGETADYHAYIAAAYGFKIGLTNWRAPFFGPKSMKHAEKALEADSLNFQANMEMGNIWNHMPDIFGGSDEKALNYYLKALEINEKESDNIIKNNWLHLNLLTMVGQMQQEMGNPERAKNYFEQALQIEPDFVWVKEELLPSLLKN